MSEGPAGRGAGDDQSPASGDPEAGLADLDEPEDFDDGDLEDADDLEGPGDLEDGDLDTVLDDDEGDGDLDGDLDGGDLGDVDLADVGDGVAGAGAGADRGDKAVRAPAAKAPAEVADSDADDDDLLADEVEASLDVILAERIRGDDSDDEDFEADDEEDEGLPNQLATVIPVRQPHEFLCQSCFLLKPPGQLADRDHQLCRDCA